jgi:hypothetical protein
MTETEIRAGANGAGTAKAAVDAAIKDAKLPKEVAAAEAQALAGDLVSEPDILTRFGKAVESTGLVGETNNAKILYLCLTSRLFELACTRFG